MNVQRYESEHRSLQAHLIGKTDRAGRLQTEAERLAASPHHPYWEEQASQSAQTLRRRVGDRLHNAFLSALPAEADEQSPQSWHILFERALAVVEALPLGRRATLEDLLPAAVDPIYLHPYETARLRTKCPACNSEGLPTIINGLGMTYHCRRNDHTWRVQSDDILARWEQHVAEQTGRWLTRDDLNLPDPGGEG